VHTLFDHFDYLGVYDIFGFHNNTKQFADLVAKGTHARVVMPDFFKGAVISPDILGDRPKIIAWITEHGSWAKTIKASLYEVVEAEKKHGAEKFGIFGFCWGAKISLEAVSEDGAFSGAAFIHPSAFEPDNAKAIKTPILNIPTKDDPDMTPFMENLKAANPSAFAKSSHHRFDDMHHGFAAARGDWSDAVQAKRANEAIRYVTEFFASL